MNTAVKPKANIYGDVGAMLADGFGSDLQSDESDIVVELEKVEFAEQIRGTDAMEDDEQTLADLGRSLRKRQAQAIVLRANPNPTGKPWLLVAGERRVRAARLEGLTTLRARVMTLTDEEADELQAAENIHRKNLTQIEEARKVKADLAKLGSIEAVLEKHNKGRAWLSKLLSLLDLPDETKRLVSENISADLEVIGMVKTIEKTDPAKAKALVDDLKATRGKESARNKVQAVKDEVKPKKADKKAPKNDGGSVATPKDRSNEAPSDVVTRDIFAGAKEGAGDVADLLNKTWQNIFEHDSVPNTLLEVMPKEDKAAADEWLKAFYDAGVKVKDSGRAVVQGLRNGQFTTEGAGSFAMVAFLHGADSEQKFNLLNILASAKRG